MKKSNSYLLGGLIGGVLFAILVLINGGTLNQAGGAMVLGIFIGKIIGIIIGKDENNIKE